MHSNVIQGHFPAGLSRAGSVKSQLHGAAVQLAPHLLRSSAGQPLPPAVRQKMESLFGTSFAEVRVHVGPHVTSIGAQAFTHGNDIHFAAGQYDPVSPAGARMLARQLAHVVQQRAGKVRNPYGTGIAIVQDRLLDAEAERMSRRVAQRYVVVPSDRVFTKLGRFPRRVSPNRPMVLRETAVFPAQERDRRRGYLRTDGSANIVNKNEPGLRVSEDGQMAIEKSHHSK